MERITGLLAALVLILAGVRFCRAAPDPVYTGAGTGKHYWIDGIKGNDKGPGTKEKPWKTLFRIESARFAPGDLVHVVAGTYEYKGMLLLQGIRGAADAWIGIQAEGDVNVRGSHSKGCDEVIRISGCRYLFLKGFDIAQKGVAYPQRGIRFHDQPNDHVAVDSCRIHDTGRNAIYGSAAGTHITINRCEIFKAVLGIYWGRHGGQSRRHNHCRVINSYFHDLPEYKSETGYGMQIKGGGRGNLIEDNVFVRCGGNKRAAICVYFISTGPPGKRTKHTDVNIIRGNVVRHCRGEGIYAAEGAIIENNILYNCRVAGICVTQRKSGSGWGRFYGNLIVRNNTVLQDKRGAGPALRIGGGPFDKPFIVANNILAATGDAGRAVAGPRDFAGTAAGNYYYGIASGSKLGLVRLDDLSVFSGTEHGAPNFLYPSSRFTFSADPPPKDGLAAVDFNGNPRKRPIPGAYGLSGGATNPGWAIVDGFKGK
jgi:hypothetical protein